MIKNNKTTGRVQHEYQFGNNRISFTQYFIFLNSSKNEVYVRKLKNPLIGILFGVFTIVIVFNFVMSGESIADLTAAIPEGDNYIAVVYVVAFLWAMIIGLYYLVIVFKQITSSIRIQRFADENGVDFFSRSEEIIERHKKISIIASRHEVARNVLVFNVSPYELEIGNFSKKFDTENSNRTTDNGYGYIHFKIDKNLPHIIVDSKSNNGFGDLSNFKDLENFEQKLELEGDFNNYFRLLAPRSYKSDALYIFTPDFMQVVKDNFKDFDIEINGHDVYLYRYGQFEFNNRSSMTDLIKLANIAIETLGRRVKLYKDGGITNNPEASLADNRSVFVKNAIKTVGYVALFAPIFIAILTGNGIYIFVYLFIVPVLPVIFRYKKTKKMYKRSF